MFKNNKTLIISQLSSSSCQLRQRVNTALVVKEKCRKYVQLCDSLDNVFKVIGTSTSTRTRTEEIKSSELKTIWTLNLAIGHSETEFAGKKLAL